MNEQRNIYKIENTMIKIVEPQISEDERNDRLHEITKTVWRLWLNARKE